MEKQTVLKAELIRPHFTEAQAKESVEKKKRFSIKGNQTKWISSIPMYLPFWLVQVEMTLKDPRAKGQVNKVYTVMVNGLNNRGLTLKGNLETDQEEKRGIYLPTDLDLDDVRETARLEALAGSKRMINPPPHRVMNSMRLVYYPLALVELEVKGVQEFQIFDYYRGGIDKFMMRYIKLREKMEVKKAQARA